MGASSSNAIVLSEKTESQDSLTVVNNNLDCEFWEYQMAGVFDSSWSNYNLFPYRGKSKRFNEFTVLKLDTNNSAANYPVKNKLFSPFKSRGKTRWHNGVDIKLNAGDEVSAAFDGVVRYSGYNDGGFGNLVIIRHHNGLETYYAHLSKRVVFANDTVHSSQKIGLGGSTGRSNGPHLHFEIRLEDQPINPAVIFDTKSFKPITDALILESHIFPPGKGTNI